MKETLDFVMSMEFWRMGLLWTLSLLISYWKLLFAPTPLSASAPPSFQTTNPVCIVTGATSGLGAAAAHALSARGFFVVLVGRSSHLLDKTMKEIKRKNGSAQLKGFEVDLSSFQSILRFRDSLQQWLSDSQMHCSIQLLINNAGILATSSRFTSEGYDQMMATNYLSAFALTKLLLPLLSNSPVPSRIVNVTSFTHRSVSSIQADKVTVSGRWFSRSKRYPFAHVYENSKLFLLLFSYELHRQLGLMDLSCHISVNAVDPGVVETNMMREVPPCLSSLAFKVLRSLCLLQSPEVGISSILDAALAPPETSGVYFFGGNGNTVSSSMVSYDPKLAKELWNTSSDLFLESQLAFNFVEAMSGPQCCSNPPIINTSCGSDCEEKYGGLNVYVTGSPKSKRAILLSSDVFGYGAPNLRKLAGRVAASGYFVVIPDFFYGDPFVYDNNRPLAVWLKDHGTDKGFEDAKSVIDILRGKGLSAIGAAGFCWGAKIVTELAKSELIQAAVLLHPSFTSVEDIEAVKSPIAVLGAEIDNYSPPELVKKFEEILNAKPQVDSYVKIFPKVAHGWAVRYDVDDEAATQIADEAHTDMLQWFAKHVK